MSMDSGSVPSNIDDLYHLRLLVLLECSDNRFRQVQMTQEQFEEVRDMLFTTVGMRNPFGKHASGDTLGVRLKENWRKHSDFFLGLSDFYPPEKL